MSLFLPNLHSPVPWRAPWPSEGWQLLGQVGLAVTGPPEPLVGDVLS